jgi:hypothetical protein
VLALIIFVLFVEELTVLKLPVVDFINRLSKEFNTDTSLNFANVP